ncbi:MAG: hypothetical protein DRO01_07960 [Thermoproteota archaeon]|nr:MAG: hypothetical protein DRO01_07960 [Candidatus Korarchaeota archaeon]
MEGVIDTIDTIARTLGLRPRAAEILHLLAREGELTISEVARALSISRRAAHDWLHHLLSRRLIRRRPVEREGRLSYAYFLPPPSELIQAAVDHLKERIRELERLLEGGDRIE